MNDNLRRHVQTLRAARSMSHGVGSFMQHLFGVYEILCAWGCPPTVATAGLFHSTYGTEFFDAGIFDSTDREALRASIGPEAEALVYQFGRINRSQLLKVTTSSACGVGHVTEAQLRDLRVIEMANLIQQRAESDRSPALTICRLWELATAGATLDSEHPILQLESYSAEAERLALAAYHSALAAPIGDASRAAEFLEVCIRYTRVVGEPHILLATIQLDAERWADAMSSASWGCNLLSRWACPWDKRMVLPDWLRIGMRIVDLAATGATDTRVWPRLRAVLKGRGG